MWAAMMENILVKTGSSGYSKGEHTVMEMMGPHCESEEASVGRVNINVKVKHLSYQQL